MQDVGDRQPDLDEEVTGPPETAAYRDGTDMRAATLRQIEDYTAEAQAA